MRIFIGCSAKEEIEKKYFDSIEKVSKLLNTKYSLTFGGNDKGSMGIIYKNFKDVIGVSVKSYEKELDKLVCKKILKTTVNERTDEIIKNSDIFLIMPGGIGTLFEFFSLLEEKRTNNLSQPIIIYNEFNYYDSLLKLLDEIYKKSFISQNDLNKFIVVNNIEELEKYLGGL